MSKRNLNKMMENATSTKSEKVKKSKGGIILIIIVALLLIAIIGFTIFKFLPEIDNEVIDRQPEIQQEEILTIEELYENIRLPIEGLGWTKLPYFMGFAEDKDLRNDAIHWAHLTALGGHTVVLPSLEFGYINDINYALNEDGSINLNYSYVVRENVEYAFAIYSQRLLNPVFGNWSTFQFIDTNPSTSLGGQSFRDMFTSEWWNNNISENNYRAIPIFADWEQDGYGGLNFYEGSTDKFFGEITSMNVNMISLEDGSGVQVDIEAQVLFTAFGQNELLTKTGILTMQLVPNRDDIYNMDRRMLINEASLTIN